MNPDAEKIAAALDRERKEKGPRGPLHGIPDSYQRQHRHAGSNDDHGRFARTRRAKPLRDAFVAQNSAKRARSFSARQTSASGPTFVRLNRRVAGVVVVDKQRILTCSIVIPADRVPDRVRQLRQICARRRSAPRPTARCLSFVGEFTRRDQTDYRPRESRRNHSDCAQPGHCWSNGAHCHRRGDSSQQ
jgi:hypothetical protein